MRELVKLFFGRWTSGVLVAAVWSVAAAASALDNSDCMTCHEDKTLVRQGTNAVKGSLYVDAAALRASVHATNACTSCHVDIVEAPHPDKFVAKPVSCGGCHPDWAASYSASGHGKAWQKGDARHPGCADCHGKHEILRSGTPKSSVSRDNLATTCGRCHDTVVKEVKNSIHGKAMAEGVRDAPSCVDCHRDHPGGQLRTASPMKIAEQVCSRCHASERLATRYNMPRHRTETFFDSYHGLAAKLGSTRAANCASCHGYHNILPSSDPRSSVNRSNLVVTCQGCHPGANSMFVQGRIHPDESVVVDVGERINLWVRRCYIALIAVVLGFLTLHNLLALRKRLQAAFRDSDRWFVRMKMGHRIQHLLLVLSFAYLSVTGFALKYPDSWLAFLVGSDEDVRRIGHRVAAVVMLILSLYHLVHLAVTREGRKLFKDLFPGFQDAKDMLANLRYFLVPGATKARFGRFGYPEKLEYWAVVWGVLVMGLTGILIWFKMEITQWMPRWVVDVAITVHLYEAILAVSAIIIWHLYHVIFDPDVYPMNWAWWDGRVSAHHYKEEHPLDPEGPDGREKAGEKAPPAARPPA